MGLPIVPGEILENTKLIKYCKHINKPNWNFINGFDILAATVSIYSGSKKYLEVINEEIAVEDIKDVANTLGVGIIKLAIACSTANPFLLIGSFLHIASGIRGIFNDGGIIFFNKVTNHYRLEVVSHSHSIVEVSSKNMIENKSDKLTIESFYENNRMK